MGICFLPRRRNRAGCLNHILNVRVGPEAEGVEPTFSGMNSTSVKHQAGRSNFVEFRAGAR